MDIDPQKMEWLAGALFIGFYAYKRYNTSRYTGIVENRSSTTFVRFAGFFGLYLLILFLIYWFLGSFVQTAPDVFARLWPLLTGTAQPMPPELAGEAVTRLTGPIVSALMLTTLLPSLPLLKSFDRWLLEKFWDLGHIPTYVFRQADKLRRAPLTFSPADRNRIIGNAEKFGIPAEGFVFEESSSVEHRWIRLCHLMLHLEAWQGAAGPKYARFVQANDAEFEELRLEFANISRHLSSYAQRRAKAQASNQAEILEVLEDLRRPLLDSVRVHYFTVCKFVARGVFASELTEKARRNTLARMGFEQDAVLTTILTPSQALTLVGWIAVAFFSISALEAYIKHSGGIRLGPILFGSLIMTTTYGTAVIAALFPKSVWRFADIEQAGVRSFGAYLLSALFAVLFGLIAIVSIRYTFNAAVGLSPEQNIDRVLGSVGWSYPYLLQSAAIAFATAFLADTFRSHPAVPQLWHRWVDVAVLGLAMLIATAIVFCWMEGIGPFEGTRDPQFRGRTDPLLFVIKGTVVGIVIGWLVPGWYRHNRLRTPMQRLSQLLNRQAAEVAREVGRLKSGELKEALSAGAAFVAAADGRIDSIEIDMMRQVLLKLEAAQALDFPVEEAITRFTDLVREHRFAEKSAAESMLAPLRPLVARMLLCDVLIYLSLAIGHADGIFGPEEGDALGAIMAELNLNPADYEIPTVQT